LKIKIFLAHWTNTPWNTSHAESVPRLDDKRFDAVGACQNEYGGSHCGIGDGGGRIEVAKTFNWQSQSIEQDPILKIHSIKRIILPGLLEPLLCVCTSGTHLAASREHA
jgi:hypothetical protein